MVKKDDNYKINYYLVLATFIENFIKINSKFKK